MGIGKSPSICDNPSRAGVMGNEQDDWARGLYAALPAQKQASFTEPRGGKINLTRDAAPILVE
ncbi:hypothetical protein LX36DRAFT_650719 [Colletotrichum falcatum]|nr:hypothetical protein LX36DRAFT_650719 [Colletotrichum falcatum]